MKFNKALLEKVRVKHRLALILLHGSQVEGLVHKKSDVDVGVVRQVGHRALKLLELIKDLNEALGTDKVDLSDLTSADPLFLFLAVREAKLLAGPQSALDDLQRRAFHKYNDYLPYLAAEQKFVKERMGVYVTA